MEPLVMDDVANAIQLFGRLLNSDDPGAENCAAEALWSAAKVTTRLRNQPCESVISHGGIACVLSGAVRKHAIRANGQRQVVDVLIPGDFLGLAQSDPGFSLEAVSDGTRIACFKKRDVDKLADTYPAIFELMQDRAADVIRRLENHLLVQGRITAKEKVGAYLATMCRRIEHEPSEVPVLPITRYDIADHLGLAVETVSRTITALRRRGAIALPSPRRVEIRDTAMMTDGL